VGEAKGGRWRGKGRKWRGKQEEEGEGGEGVSAVEVGQKEKWGVVRAGRGERGGEGVRRETVAGSRGGDGGGKGRGRVRKKWRRKECLRGEKVKDRGEARAIELIAEVLEGGVCYKGR